MKEVIEIINQYKECGNTEDVVLDDIKIEHLTADIKHQLEQIPDLIYLSMNDCKLKTLNHFPHIKNLTTLELNDNEFPAKELTHLSHLTTLKSLDLDGLQITKVEQLEPLKALKNLERLEINECEFAEQDESRKLIFEYLPSLKIFNGED